MLSRRLFYVLIFTFPTFWSFCPPHIPCRLKVEIEGVKKITGRIYIALYKNKEDFNNNKPFAYFSADVKNHFITAESPDLTPGVYAVKVFQDLNGNKKLDTSLLGIPKESFGFSNNAMGFFGPPDFQDCSFYIPSEGHSIKIKLKNF